MNRFPKYLFFIYVILVNGLFVESQYDNLEFLSKLVEEKGPVLKLNLKDYMRFVIRSPRAYDLSVLYVWKNQTGCKNCRDYIQYFSAVAQRYQAKGTMDIRNSGKKIFFVTIAMDEDPVFGIMHNWKKPLEWIYLDSSIVFPERAIRKHERKVSIPPAMILSRYAYSGDLKSFVLKFVNKHSGMTSVTYKPPLLKRLSALPIVFSMLIVIVLSLIVIVTHIRKRTELMAIGALGIQALTCGATCYCLIHKAPLFGRSETKKILLFNPNARKQYVLEGLLMSSLMIMGGMFLYISGRSVNKKNAKGRSSISLVFMLLSYACYYFVMSTQFKKSWLPPVKFFPPSGFITGPLINDRRNSF